MTGYFGYKNLTELPQDLDPNMDTLLCNDNLLTELNKLPNKICFIDCSCNQLTNIDNLPDSVAGLDCYDNKITCLNKLPRNVRYLDIRTNPLIDIKGIWRCENLVEIMYNQDNLTNELKVFCIVTGTDLVECDELYDNKQ